MNTQNKILLAVAVVGVSIFYGATAFALTAPQVQTNSATNIQSNSATLNGTMSDMGGDTNVTIWFQWGTDTNYGNETSDLTQYYTGPFNQSLNNLTPNTTYHFRVAAENDFTTTYGSDMTFYTNQNGQINTNNNGSQYVQTNFATYVSNNQATLNGTLSQTNSYNNSYNTSSTVWFQWGTDTNYGNTTPQQTISNASSFLQVIGNLNNNTTYHFRAVAQNSSMGTVYGQDLTFNTGTNNGYINNNNNNNTNNGGSLSIQKQVINLTSGNLNWQTSVNAKPGDVLSFAVTIQAGSQDIHNVFVRDDLPANLIYKGNLTVNATLSPTGSPTVGINLGTIPAGGIAVIAYQTQVAPASNFSLGQTTLNNGATVTSTEAGTQQETATVIVNNSAVSGASSVSTGMTNNPITDSFFLPMFLIVLMSWLYFTGRVYRFADWIETRL